MVVADATERASKIKFWSPDEKHIVHKAWDECSHVEQNWIRERQPERVPDDARVREDGGRYADLVDLFSERLKTARAAFAESRDRGARLEAQVEMQEYAWAIQNAREAATIPEDADCWFVVAPGGMAPVRIPPRLDEFKTAPLYEPVRFNNHVLRTSDAIAIAWLRRVMREGQAPNLKELTGAEWGKYPLIGNDGILLGYVDRATYDAAVERQQAKP